MLLHMLGYKEEDVGPFWPNYIAQAQAIGLTDGVTITDARAAVKRGDAAVLLLNALNTDKKGEEGSTLLDKVASSTVKDCILLETGKTYSALAADAALFYESGVVDTESPRKTAGTLDSSMIGVYGTIVIRAAQALRSCDSNGRPKPMRLSMRKQIVSLPRTEHCVRTARPSCISAATMP